MRLSPSSLTRKKVWVWVWKLYYAVKLIFVIEALRFVTFEVESQSQTPYLCDWSIDVHTILTTFYHMYYYYYAATEDMVVFRIKKQ